MKPVVGSHGRQLWRSCAQDPCHDCPLPLSPVQGMGCSSSSQKEQPFPNALPQHKIQSLNVEEEGRSSTSPGLWDSQHRELIPDGHGYSSARSEPCDERRTWTALKRIGRGQRQTGYSWDVVPTCALFVARRRWLQLGCPARLHRWTYSRGPAVRLQTTGASKGKRTDGDTDQPRGGVRPSSNSRQQLDRRCHGEGLHGVRTVPSYGISRDDMSTCELLGRADGSQLHHHRFGRWRVNQEWHRQPE